MLPVTLRISGNSQMAYLHSNLYYVYIQYVFFLCAHIWNKGIYTI